MCRKRELAGLHRRAFVVYAGQQCEHEGRADDPARLEQFADIVAGRAAWDHNRLGGRGIRAVRPGEIVERAERDRHEHQREPERDQVEATG